MYGPLLLLRPNSILMNVDESPSIIGWLEKKKFPKKVVKKKLG